MPSAANLWTIYLSTINSLIKIEINQALNEQIKYFDKTEENLKETKFLAHIKQILYFIKKLGGIQNKNTKILNNTKEANVRNLAFTKLLTQLEDNLYNNSIINNEKKPEILKIIRLALAEEIGNLLSNNSFKILSVSIKDALEAFHKKLSS